VSTLIATWSEARIAGSAGGTTTVVDFSGSCMTGGAARRATGAVAGRPSVAGAGRSASAVPDMPATCSARAATRAFRLPGGPAAPRSRPVPGSRRRRAAVARPRRYVAGSTGAARLRSRSATCRSTRRRTGPGRGRSRRRSAAATGSREGRARSPCGRPATTRTCRRSRRAAPCRRSRRADCRAGGRRVRCRRPRARPRSP
jgi:hypothetical protein